MLVLATVLATEVTVCSSGSKDMVAMATKETVVAEIMVAETTVVTNEPGNSDDGSS